MNIGATPPKGMTQQIHDRFGDVNRHMPGYLTPVGPNTGHQRWSKRYDHEMQRWMRQNPDATLDDVIREGERRTRDLEKEYSKCVD